MKLYVIEVLNNVDDVEDVLDDGFWESNGYAVNLHWS